MHENQVIRVNMPLPHLCWYMYMHEDQMLGINVSHLHCHSVFAQLLGWVQFGQ